MRTPSQTYNAQVHAHYMTGAPWPTGGSPVVRLPDPDDYDGLARDVCRRALEMTGEARARGLSILAALDEAEAAMDDYLEENGWPEKEHTDDWDDDYDWRLR